MGRIMAIDYGIKRTGLAVTDENRLIATPLTTVETHSLMDYLNKYCTCESVDIFVVGEAKHLNGTPAESAKIIEPFVANLRKKFPNKEIARMDERFTSKIAFQSMIASGLKKKQRQNKALIDTISATLILQNYMDLKSTKRT
ncbi:MAG: Holliday junction resolvase RuvX [Bacteroidales bacterium]|nr:Holliday junction resolvase RuvX [Bacteroidales bacterium]